jgi:hypothetical protein
VTRSLMTRLVRACVAAFLILPMVTAAPVMGGPEETGEVIFRVTLQGQVHPGHSFGVRREYVDGCCVVDPIEMVCGIPNPSTPQLPLCSQRTYEFVWDARVGATIEYELLRWTSSDLSSDAAERYLKGRWIVHGGRQVISLTYLYPSGTALGGAAPGGGASMPVLPDTAMPADS